MDRAEAEHIYAQGMEAVVTALMAMDAKITKLEQILGKNSSNSDKPPSSDTPFGEKKRKKITGLRRQGAQPGHQGKNRKLRPAEEMDEIHHLYPTACRHCQRLFESTEKIQSATPLRHQTFVFVQRVRPQQSGLQGHS